MKRFLSLRTAPFMTLVLLLMVTSLVSLANGSNKASEKRITIAYTGNTWSYLVPCPA